jgi:O-antigen/teichoic acid export membrane protein
LQLAYVVVAARALGADVFGVFVTVTAAGLVLSPLCGWGANTLVLRAVSRGGAWTPGLRAKARNRDLLSGLALGILLVLGSPWLLGVPWQLALAVAVADLLCAPLHELAAHILQGAEDAAGYAAVMLLHGGGRFAAALALVSCHGGLATWGWCYAAGSLVALAAAWLVVSRRRPCVSDDSSELPWAMGGQFVGAGLARVLISDGDKLVLSCLAPPAAVAVYGLAMRGVDAASIPLRAAIVGWIPRFFRAGATGDASHETTRVLPAAVMLGLVGVVGLLAAAPLLPLILGPGYRESSGALLLLAPLVLIRAVQAVYGEALTGADRQWPRTVLLLCGSAAVAGGAYAALAIWPAAAWRGPAVVQLLVGVALTLALVRTVMAGRVAAHG